MRFKNYLINGFHWKKILHFLIIILVSFIVSMILWGTKYRNIHSNKISSNIILIFGMIPLAYGLLAIIFGSQNFGFALFKQQKRMKFDRLKQKLKDEEQKPKTTEQKMKIRALKKQIESREKRELKKEQNKNNLVFYLLIFIGLVFVITAIILAFV